jgi:uncharacterized repeat protein (TIGR03803 family)
VKLREWKTGLVLFVMCVAAGLTASAQTFTTLQTFNEYSPYGSLIQGIDGNLYGQLSGPNWGEIYKMTPEGTVSTIHTFVDKTGGAIPSGLTVETNGNLYGTTERGGATSTTCPQSQGCGTVFGFNSAGKVFTVHSFNGVDGTNPIGGLALGPDGATFFGTTYGDRAKGATGAVYGTIFKVTPSGAFTLLHSFSMKDGAYPVGPLVIGANQALYGTTSSGGLYGGGTVFRITAKGAFTTLHNFYGPTDGCGPGALLLSGVGPFYGTASYCGPTSIHGSSNNGTIFMVDSDGQFKTLYSFTGGSDGSNPSALVWGEDGYLYGATSVGGQYGLGTLFEVYPDGPLDGQLTLLHTFSTDGHPNFLTQGTNGTFYGTTPGGGSTGATVFSFSTGLPPFLITVPTQRAVGTKVLILGQGLTGATSVTFRNIEAEFTIDSDTEITATVPAPGLEYVRVGGIGTKVPFYGIP